MKIRRVARLSGQAVLEYAVLISLVAAAFIAMSLYVKRAVQGKLYAMEDAVTGKQVHAPVIDPWVGIVNW